MGLYRRNRCFALELFLPRHPDQFTDQSHPASLVGSAQSLPGIAVEVFVEQDIVTEMRVGKLRVSPVVGTLSVVMFFKNIEIKLISVSKNE
jgi:hypothetical protein